MDNNIVKTTFSELSDRENEVVELISAGKSEKEIAYILHIDKGTVNNHTRNIRKKLGVTKNLEIMGAYVANFKGKKFNLEQFRKYGIAIFLIFVNVCKIDV